MFFNSLSMLNHTSIAPYFIIMAVVMLCAYLIARYIPFYKQALKAEGGVNESRYENLDGLRGFLALGVFFQHAVTNFAYFSTGIWQITDVKFYRHLGGESVILFFIITSFLYWSKAIAKKGDMNIAGLYRSRFLRLAPMYLVSAVVVTVVALIETRSSFSLNTIGVLMRDILSWLTLGINTTISVNGSSIIPINAGIHWTLHFEWIFYLLLPIGALALKSKELRLMLIPFLAYALVAPNRGYWIIFFFGILAAHIVERAPSFKWASKWWMGIVPILGLILVYSIQYKPYSLIQYAVTLGIFLLFIYGNNLFGLLKTSSAKILGMMSYSIYLIHGIMLYTVLNIANNFYPIVDTTPIQFWSLITFTAILTVAVSALTYRYVEYPFLRMIRAKKVDGAPVELSEKVM